MVGTPHAESAESYVCRLAISHHVSRLRIDEYVCGQSPELALVGRRRQPPRLDSPLQPAAQYLRTLAKLTQQDDVAGLGVSWLWPVLSTVGATRRYRAWCACCVEESARAGTPFVWQAVWALAGYNRCIKHDAVLDTACRACGRPSDTARVIGPNLSECSWCGTSLGRSAGLTGYRQCARQSMVAFDQATARLLAELVAKSDEVRRNLCAPDLVRLVRAAIDGMRAETEADLARKANVSKGALNCLIRGKAGKPSLNVLLRLCVAADVSLAGLLNPDLWHQGSLEIGTPLETEKWRRPRQGPIDWELVRKVLAAEANSEEPRAPTRLAAELEIDLASLRSKCPTEVAALRRRINAVRDQRRLMDMERMEHRVTVAWRLAGRPLSARQTSAAIHARRKSPVFAKAFLRAKASWRSSPKL